MKQASGFYADSLEMLLDTMCNVLGAIIFIVLVLAVMARHSSTSATAADSSETLTNQLNLVLQSNAVIEANIQQTLLALGAPHQQAPTNLMRLPNAGQTTKQAWDVIVRFGQVYPLRLLTPGTSSSQRNISAGLEWLGGERTGVTVVPKPGQGAAPESGVANMVRAFQHGSKTNFYFAFWVYEDSFVEFNHAKETAARLGFQYGWEPMARDARLQLGNQGQTIPPQN